VTARKLYPPCVHAETVLCVTNRRRVAENELANKRLAPPDAVLSLSDGLDPRAQLIRLWPGLILRAGCTNRKLGLRNALSHVVESVDAEYCVLEREGVRLTLPTQSVAGLFRMTHSLTIDSSQSMTLQNHVLIVESNHPHFTLRRLLVALGRSPSRHLVHMQ